MNISKTALIIFSSFMYISTLAQFVGTEEDYYGEFDDEYYPASNSNELQEAPIPDSDVLFKKGITRAVDLRELQNEPFMAKGNELPKLLIEAVQNGEIRAFADRDIVKSKTLELNEFNQRLQLPSNNIEEDTAFINPDDIWGEEPGTAAPKSPEYYFPKDLYQMEITEDVYFNKDKSQWKYDIKTLTILLPADHPDNIRGIEEHIATFNFNECSNLFAKHPNAIWYNPKNEGKHLNLAEAFKLRLFSSYIIKVSNPKDEYLIDTYGGGKKGIVASKNAEFKLMEFEHHLWEY